MKKQKTKKTFLNETMYNTAEAALSMLLEEYSSTINDEVKKNKEAEINNILRKFNEDMFHTAEIIKVNNITTESRKIFPGIRRKIQVDRIYIDSVKFGECLNIYKEDDDVIFYDKEEPIWVTTPIMNMSLYSNDELDIHTIILVSQDLQTYIIRFSESANNRLFKEMEEINI